METWKYVLDIYLDIICDLLETLLFRMAITWAPHCDHDDFPHIRPGVDGQNMELDRRRSAKFS